MFCLLILLKPSNSHSCGVGGGMHACRAKVVQRILEVSGVPLRALGVIRVGEVCDIPLSACSVLSEGSGTFHPLHLLFTSIVSPPLTARTFIPLLKETFCRGQDCRLTTRSFRATSGSSWSADPRNLHEVLATTSAVLSSTRRTPLGWCYSLRTPRYPGLGSFRSHAYFK